jgi:hypothetical protein
MKRARRMASASLLAAALGAALIGCAPRTVPVAAGPPIVEMRDDADIPRPRPTAFLRTSHHLDNFGKRQARLRLDPLPPPPALDVNAAGEVPNSTWFTNRAATVTPAEVARGAGGDAPHPERCKPWTIVAAKVGGLNPGFRIQDACGRRHLLKFDRSDAPVIATAAGAIAARLFWALGYNTPDDRVVYFDLADLLIADGVELRNDAGAGRHLTRDDLAVLLAGQPRVDPAGRYQGLTSALLPGEPLGGFAYRGTRRDDPNDTIAHERRRVLRALRVFGAWLQHVDLKRDNTLDMYVAEDGRRFVRHYLVDFDACLGGFWAARREPRVGFTYDIDLAEAGANLLGLGLRRPAYERQGEPVHSHVGLYEAEVYDPAAWKPAYLNDYIAWCDADDARWAAGVLASLTDEHLAAAVEAGRFPDPDAATELLRVLRERRDRTISWARGRP